MQRQGIFFIENANDLIPEVEVVEVHHFKKRSEKICFILKKSFLEYCSVSSIGGFVHLSSHGALHRAFWFTLLVLSVIGCYFTIMSLLGIREILILNEDNTVSTSLIPFPAVTVCTTIKADHRRFNYKKMELELIMSLL